MRASHRLTRSPRERRRAGAAARVVVVGGGFGGLQAVSKLRRAPVEVTLVDRRNFHLFQPLTYQVATGALSPGEIAYPLRAIFKRAGNVRVVMAEVADFDLDAREVHLRQVGGVPSPERLGYDTLIVAGGSRYSYFGHEEWREYAAEVKSLESALAVRSRLLAAFEAAEAEPDPAERAAWLTFVVVGAGPTGVEMAGQIGELAHDTLRRDFRSINPRAARILLVEAAERVLTTFPPSLSAKAERSLERLGVTVLTGRTVIGIDHHAVTLNHPDREGEQIPSRTVIWAAGVTASGLAGRLAELTGAESDRAGRVTVEPDLTVPGHPEVFAIGDMVRVRNPDGAVSELPGVAPVAMQQGRYAGNAVRARLRGRDIPPFRYRDKGNLATIGRAAAVADIKGLRLSGFLAWSTWLLVHLWYLIGFQNRLLVLIRWSISFATHGRGARLITAAAVAGTDAPYPPSAAVNVTRVSRHVNAPRARVYAALIDPNAIVQWKVPSGMTSHVHEFEGREGGRFRISLTYDTPAGVGKTTARTDTYHGRFVKLVPNELVIEVDEFETADPAMRGEMTITITLSESNGGTDVLGVHEGLPPGISTADNEAGWRSALERLAALVEAG